MKLYYDDRTDKVIEKPGRNYCQQINLWGVNFGKYEVSIGEIASVHELIAFVKFNDGSAKIIRNVKRGEKLSFDMDKFRSTKKEKFESDVKKILGL